MSQINFQSLEDFVQRESDDISTIHLWYEKLSEYELEGTESPKDIDTLVYALKYLMNYSFTAAEELKEIAEREAVAIAEKEEQWEEHRQSMREEIEALRQRITSRVDASESSEAFRAQIDSLKEENRILQQLSRDRDMEMADQRDRFEALVARADMLTRERDALQDQKAQMEDNIRELNRRISSKSEDTSTEWETRKLKLRNEQAVTLSKQMQAVVAQNDQLRVEVDRVSDALEDATRLIEDSSRRMTELSEELRSSQKNENHLTQDNRSLREKLEAATKRIDEVESQAMDADEILKTKIETQNETINQLQQRLYEAQMEVEELRSKISTDTTAEREAELEKLKQELITATKMARTLLGQETSSRGEVSDTTDWPRRLMQSEQRLLDAQTKIDALRSSAAELEETIVQKELHNDETIAELERLREMKFGDAREELSHLQEQIIFRDEQIAKLSRHCTMLQIELGKYAEGFIPEMIPSKDEARETPQPSRNEPAASASSKPPKKEIKQEKSTEKPATVATGRKAQIGRERTKTTRSLDEYEQQAMIIAGLNYELFSLLTEMEKKNNQLVEMEHALKIGKKAVDEGRAKLKLAYDELAEQKAITTTENSTKGEENEMELMELRVRREDRRKTWEFQRFSETIRLGGSEAERRTEEVTRKLIAERIQKIRLARSEENLKNHCNRATEAARRFRERLITARVEGEKKAARLQYELDMTCYEMAAAQNKLLHSIPLRTYEQLSRKYRELLKKETLGGENIEDPPTIEFDLLPEKPEANAQELAARNEYLKKIVQILTDQNEFWNNETDILQRENDELKKFLEDLENESDAKGVLVSIQSRLMETIRELSTIAREQVRERRKIRDAEETLARQKVIWSAERKRHVHVISLLQQGYQNQKNNNLATITVTQMEILRQRIVDVSHEKARATEEREQAEKMREEAETLKTQVSSEINAQKMITSENGNLQKLERMLRQYMAGEAQQMAKSQRLERLLSLKEKQERQRQEEIEDLQKSNEELLTVISVSKATRAEEQTMETVEKTRQEAVMVETEAEESGYEMDFDSGSSDGSSPRNGRVIIKTVVEDNSKEYEKRLAKIKETAEMCIRSYREQLIQKDAAIESYRELLLAKIEQTSTGQKETKKVVREEKRVVDREMEERLRVAVLEVARLKEDVEDLEAANRELFRERRKSTIPLVEDIMTQTEADPLEGDKDSLVSAHHPHIITPIPEVTERSNLTEMDFTDEKQNAALQHRREIRRLQDRIRRLTTTNKELLIACEKIKEEAISQISTKVQRETDREVEDVTQLRLETVRLRTDLRLLRQKLKESQDTVDKLRRDLDAGKKSSEEEVLKWEQKKKTEESLKILRKRLQESEKSEKEARDRLAKREKRLEELQDEVRNKQREIDRLNKRLSELRSEKESSVKDSQQMVILRDRQATLEERIREKEREIVVTTSKLKSSEKKAAEMSREISTLRRTVESRQTEANTQSRQKETVVKETIITVDTKLTEKLEEELKRTKKQLRVAELHLAETREKLEFVEKDLAKAQEDYSRLMKRFNLRDDGSSGAVAVLKDKLQAKDREIAQLKVKITQLERRLSQ